MDSLYQLFLILTQTVPSKLPVPFCASRMQMRSTDLEVLYPPFVTCFRKPHLSSSLIRSSQYSITAISSILSAIYFLLILIA